MLSYEEYEKALKSLGIVSKFTSIDLKNKYLKLSKKYHPDMSDGNDEKFKEINESYKLLQKYLQNFRFDVDEEEFYKQNPFARKSNDWFYDF